jgi:hypothetical protein
LNRRNAGYRIPTAKTAHRCCKRDTLRADLVVMLEFLLRRTKRRELEGPGRYARDGEKI